MKRSWLLNGILLAVVVALGWFVYLRPPDGPASYALSSLKNNEVAQIRIERSGDADIVLEKKGDLWLITAPFTARADPFHVQRLLAILSAKSAHRYAATDLARFDLDQPHTRLVINGQAFSFGIVSTIAREQYVLSGDAVYAINPAYGAALPPDASQMIRRSLFASDEVPVRFEFRNFTVARDDHGWRMTPQAGELSQDDFNRWVDGWREAAAVRAEPYDQRKWSDEITVTFKNGRKLTLGILQREPELVLVRPDEKLQYYFFPDTAKRLLTPPGSGPRQPQNAPAGGSKNNK